MDVVVGKRTVLRYTPPDSRHSPFLFVLGFLAVLLSGHPLPLKPGTFLQKPKKDGYPLHALSYHKLINLHNEIDTSMSGFECLYRL